MQIVALFCKVLHHHVKSNDVAFAASNVCLADTSLHNYSNVKVRAMFPSNLFLHTTHTHTLAVLHIMVSGRPTASSNKMPCLRHEKIGNLTCCFPNGMMCCITPFVLYIDTDGRKTTVN